MGLSSSQNISCTIYFCDPHKGFGIVNKAEIDVFLELSCFFHDPVDIGNLISGSSAFSKTILKAVKNPPASAGDTGSIPGPGRCHMPWGS